MGISEFNFLKNFTENYKQPICEVRITIEDCINIKNEVTISHLPTEKQKNEIQVTSWLL